jgi:hypothetical protein
LLHFIYDKCHLHKVWLKHFIKQKIGIVPCGTTTAKYKKLLQSTIFPTYKTKVKERKQDIRTMRVPLA